MNHRKLQHAGRRVPAGSRCLLIAVAVAAAGCQSAATTAHPAGPAAPPRPTTTTSTSTPVASHPAPTTNPTTPSSARWQPLVPGLEQLTAPNGVVTRIDPSRLEVALVPGTAEPGGAFPEGGMVPTDRRAALVMAINAGFKRADARGGELVDGRTVGTLMPGAASLVIRADGSADVSTWDGSQGANGPPASAVVQNLVLLVDNGQPAPDLGTHIIERWGVSFRPALPVAIWRSGAGIDSRGRLLFAVGVNVVPAQLAQLLIAGGAIRGMQLDINHLWVFAALFNHPDPERPEQVQAQPLLAGMGPTPAHVLAPGPRDFLAVYRRPPATGLS